MEKKHFTTSNHKTVIDLDGNLYRVVQIGSQYWLKENLRVTRYCDGTPINNMEDESWSNTREGAYCHVENHHDLKDTRYGLLYNYYAVEDKLSLCPVGWHIPSSEEWIEFIDFLGGIKVAGSRIKDISSGIWNIVLKNVSDLHGFEAVPAGGRGRLGAARDLGYYATWWSSTPVDLSFAWHYGLYPDREGFRFNPGHKSSGFSIRCIKD